MGFEALTKFRDGEAEKRNIICGAWFATPTWGDKCDHWAEWWLGDSPVCRHHAQRVLDSLDHYIDAKIEDLLPHAVRLITDEREVTRAQREADEALWREENPRPDAIVYYAGRGEFIKIGSTTNITARLQGLARNDTKHPRGMALGPVTLLATHSGGMKAERILHDRFAIERDLGEWFRKSPRLLAHIDRIVARRAAS